MANAKTQAVRRKSRVRGQVKRAANGRVRLSVHRSSKHIYAQLVNDLDGVTFLNYPWVFHTDPRLASLPDPTATLSQDLKSLQALGVDSYYLLRRFHQIG